MNQEFKKGNLAFLTTPFTDLIYVIQSQEGERVTCKKLDSPPKLVETLSLSLLTKLTEEQEKLLPLNLMVAIEKQRRVVYAPVKKEKRRSLDSLMKGLGKQSLEEIFQGLAEMGITEKEEIL